MLNFTADYNQQGVQLVYMITDLTWLEIPLLIFVLMLAAGIIIGLIGAKRDAHTKHDDGANTNNNLDNRNPDHMADDRDE